METPTRKPFVLGLDLGARSVGWAVVDLQEGEPAGLRAAGSRCFEAGVSGSIDEGRDEARGQQRRQARQVRRQLARRQLRRTQLLRTLVANGLLPPLEVFDSLAIHRYLAAFDQGLRSRHLSADDRVGHQVLFYRLRTRALDEVLELHDFGRVLYQFGQRRGFLSGRKRRMKEGEEEGLVRKSIAALAEEMQAAGARTLGEYLAGLDPFTQRLRARWTARSMYEQEFAALWASQARFHDALTDGLRKKLAEVFFFQRPLKSQKGRVGECDLVPGRKRAPLACREAQRFRILQAVNNLRVARPGESEVELSPDERKRLLEALTAKGDLTFARVRKVLGLPKETEINLERGGEKRLVGHRTDAKMAAAFGARWEALGEPERDRIVDEVLSMEDPEALGRKAEKVWGLDPAAAAVLRETTFEPGYAAFSRKALRQLLPAMEAGEAVETARRRLFPEAVAARPAIGSLPRVEEALPALRNPAVARALTELRKVVNAIVRKWGVPEVVRIELARDLRNSRERRYRMARENRERETSREKAREEIRRSTGIAAPSRSDIEKYLLAEECGWECPYTGRRIGMTELFGEHPAFDIEHIWPLSRSLDNSFLNKTLCFHEENREHKRNRTPMEAYGNDTARFEQILARVGQFRGSARFVKLARFAADEILSDFTERQLQDTRYATRMAMRYLGTLYGGTVDADGRRRVQAGAGGLTAIVRNELGLNSILGDGGLKSRDDHRHHAVDALAIALLDPGLVQRLQRAAERAPSHRRRHFAPLDPPWEGFLPEVQRVVDEVVVSHRTGRKISGALHKETNYSREIRTLDENGGIRWVRRLRRPVHLLTARQVEKIADHAVREAVRRKLEEVGGKADRLEEDPPVLEQPDGRRIPIRRVRVEESVNPRRVGSEGRERHVETDANHHMAIFARLDADGAEVAWEAEVVSQLEAQRRLRSGEPVIRWETEPGRSFKFSLSPGDTIELELNGVRRLLHVRSVWMEGETGRIACVNLADARQIADLRRASSWFQPRLSGLRSGGCRKVEVSPLGEVFPAGG
ncbi:MAG TPA: type II CRISPR RNA-guided endonuclease Cas9 [Thermoanaerobaculia bacterium]|nr:type II CRISPR RNA-guided endonuclease Cas9 [Thermoanaerobaculia bacterium]